MDDSYPTILTWILRACAGGLALFSLLSFTPVGRDLPNRASAAATFLLFAGLSWGIGELTQGSRSQDAVREANREVNRAQAAFEAADEEYRALVASAAPSTQGQGGVSSSAQSMSFDNCLARIRTMSQRLGAPENLVETSQARIVRFRATDGSVLVTCSRPDGRMIVTESPSR